MLTHNLRIGGTWRFSMDNGRRNPFHHFGTFIEISRPNRLIFTWASEEQVGGWRDADGNPTIVTIDFTSDPPWVEVAITHQNLITDHARQALTEGWAGSLDQCSSFLEIKETT